MLNGDGESIWRFRSSVRSDFQRIGVCGERAGELARDYTNNGKIYFTEIRSECMQRVWISSSFFQHLMFICLCAFFLALSLYVPMNSFFKKKIVSDVVCYSVLLLFSFRKYTERAPQQLVSCLSFSYTASASTSHPKMHARARH